MLDLLNSFYQAIFGGVVIAPQYLLACIPVAFVLYKMRNIKTGFWGWLLPKEIYKHKSTVLDVKLFLLGRAVTVTRLGSLAIMTAYFTVAFHDFLEINPSYVAPPIVAAFLLFLVHDLAQYIVHRTLHSTKHLWPLHAVHHSAEVMTPVAFYRQHPLGTIVSVVILAAVSGMLQGAILALVSAKLTPLEIAGLNAFFVIGILLMGNFHHSHIWISFGPFWERIIISPAQHQIHHSAKPEHYNKNFGSTLAIWDWLFGTLYVTAKEEQIILGLSQEEDAPLMTHRFWPVMIDPVKRVFTSFRSN